MTAATDAVLDLCAFIDASPSPYHAAESVAARLRAGGFTELDEREDWTERAHGKHFMVRGGSLVAWVRPDGAAATEGWRLIGAHTDSPNLRVKPNADTGRAGIQQLGVEVYGGPLLNSWLDRDLGLSGRVALRDGTLRLLLVDRPVLRIPQLCIHLDRDIMSTGLLLNPQQHLSPIWGTGPVDGGAFKRFVASELGVGVGDVVAWDVMVHDLSPAAIGGRDGELLAAARLDNQCSCWAATDALLACAETTERPLMIVLFDHEEVGSGSGEGAQSPIIETVLERVLGGDRASMRRALADSHCASADMAHATHPNYAERHEPNHWIALNGGPVIKSNASLRYATDARTAGMLITACEAAGIAVQRYVNRNDLPCGSTIGPITTTRLGIGSVDVGAPMLAMHSARETMGTADVATYRAALQAFLQH